MDMRSLEIIRIPFAAVLFVSSAYLWWTFFNTPSTPIQIIGGVLCIGALVYSMVLFSNMNVLGYRH
jgi:hypothetical protein